MFLRTETRVVRLRGSHLNSLSHAPSPRRLDKSGLAHHSMGSTALSWPSFCGHCLLSWMPFFLRHILTPLLYSSYSRQLPDKTGLMWHDVPPDFSVLWPARCSLEMVVNHRHEHKGLGTFLLQGFHPGLLGAGGEGSSSERVPFPPVCSADLCFTYWTSI